MREITLFPGESITIDDTIIKAVQRGGQFIGTPFVVPKTGTPAHPQELPSTPIQPCDPPSPFTTWGDALAAQYTEPIRKLTEDTHRA